MCTTTTTAKNDDDDDDADEVQEEYTANFRSAGSTIAETSASSKMNNRFATHGSVLNFPPFGGGGGGIAVTYGETGEFTISLGTVASSDAQTHTGAYIET